MYKFEFYYIILLFALTFSTPNLIMSTKLDEYEEVRVLGQGAFGKAILVYHKGLNKNFVMKVIAISNMK